MTSEPPQSITHDFPIRVRYEETDQGGILYHGNYFTYFEVGRTELLRSLGFSYRKMEEEGTFAVVVKASCSYHKPARYDDLLTIRTTLVRIARVKIEYEHLILRDNERLATGSIVLAFVDRNGTIQKVPDWMKPE